jgi:hypothetical protein
LSVSKKQKKGVANANKRRRVRKERGKEEVFGRIKRSRNKAFVKRVF